MANTLTARVKLDVSQAEKSVQRLQKKLEQLQKVIAQSGTKSDQIERGMRKAVTPATTLESRVRNVSNNARTAANSSNQMANGLKKSASHASILTKNLRGLISTYVGLMGAQAVVNASDTITSAENRLNYTNSSLLGDKGTNADGSYSTATLNATEQTMDNMYSSAQKVRMAYSDMMQNVSKSMALASDAFDGNMDSAIRFQEIMAEAYTLGGASAAEMSSSMYQMIQALGSGLLQGDELRSIREGAPLAYKAIEEFAQKVYDTDKSLKDLASQGAITSELVIDAMMAAGEGMDKAFANADKTFAQTFTNIKNVALKAFEPVLQKLNDALNSDLGQAIAQGVCNALILLANILLFVMDLFGAFFAWCSENWYWLQYIVAAAVIAIGIHLASLAAQAVIAGIKAFWAFITGMSPLYTWILLIGLLVGALVWMANEAESGCDFIYDVCYGLVISILVLFAIVAIAYFVTGTLILSTTQLTVIAIIAIIALLVMTFMKYAGEILGAAYWLGAGISNIWTWVKHAAIATWAIIQTRFEDSMNKTRAIGAGVGAALGAIWDNIGIWWDKTLAKMTKAMLEFALWVAPLLNGLIDKVNPLLDFLGGGTLDRINEDAIREAITVEDGTINTEYKNIGEAYNAAYNAERAEFVGLPSDVLWNNHMEQAEYEYKDLDAAYQEGFNKGEDIKKGINDWFDEKKAEVLGIDILDGLNELLGLDNDPAFGREQVIDDPKVPTDPEYGFDASQFNPEDYLGDDWKDVIDGIKNDTGSIADSMELTEEDLKYLRQLAEKEWKKEYTTAEIKVDMNNVNTINNQGDLDGWVTTLADKLYEELSAVADGVYA